MEESHIYSTNPEPDHHWQLPQPSSWAKTVLALLGVSATLALTALLVKNVQKQQNLRSKATSDTPTVNLSFSPETITVSPNQQFQIHVMIDPHSNPVTGVQLSIMTPTNQDIYSAGRLVNADTYLRQIYVPAFSAPGTPFGLAGMEIGSLCTTFCPNRTAAGTLATFNLTAVRSGTFQLHLNQETVVTTYGSSANAAILGPNATIFVLEGTPAPTPTSSPTATPTPTSSPTPPAGSPTPTPRAPRINTTQFNGRINQQFVDMVSVTFYGVPPGGLINLTTLPPGIQFDMSNCINAPYGPDAFEKQCTFYGTPTATGTWNTVIDASWNGVSAQAIVPFHVTN